MVHTVLSCVSCLIYTIMDMLISDERRSNEEQLITFSETGPEPRRMEGGTFPHLSDRHFMRRDLTYPRYESGIVCAYKATYLPTYLSKYLPIASRYLPTFLGAQRMRMRISASVLTRIFTYLPTCMI